MTPEQRREWLMLDLESNLIGPWQRIRGISGTLSESFSLEREGIWMTRGLVRFIDEEKEASAHD